MFTIGMHNVNAAGLCRMYAMCMMMIMMMMYNSNLQAPVGHADASVSVSAFLDASDGMNGFSGSAASNVFVDAPDGWNLTHTPAPDGMAHISDDMPFLSYTTFLDESVLSLESCAGSPAELDRWNTSTLESFEHVKIRSLSIEQISEYMISEVHRLTSYYDEQADLFVEQVYTVEVQTQTTYMNPESLANALGVSVTTEILIKMFRHFAKYCGKYLAFLNFRISDEF